MAQQQQQQKKSAFDTPWFNSQGNDFFNELNISKTAHLILTAETDDFDDEVTQQWQDEDFHTVYVPLGDGGQDYVNRIHAAGDAFGAGEYYGIVAYGEAATIILEAHRKPNTPKLCAIVAYYPSAIPTPSTKFPRSVQVLVHLAGSEIGVRKTAQVLGIQGKRNTVRKRLDPGAGYGQSLKLGYKAYTYSSCESGFAEHDLDEYDAVAEGVAFTRSLTTVRRGFRIEPDVEGVHDPLTDATKAGETEKAMKQTRPYAHVIYGPTLSGGVGTKDLGRFYQEFFQPLPPSFKARLLSRTIGTDRVVDELFVSLVHDQEIPWMLPDIPETGKKVEIGIVSIVCVRGGKLESEHVYWDQASVLVQVGLLSPKMVPEAMKKKGVEELPITGAEAARAMKRGSSKHLNELMADW